MYIMYSTYTKNIKCYLNTQKYTVKIVKKNSKITIALHFLELLHKKDEKNGTTKLTKHFIFKATFLHKALNICTQGPGHSTQLLVVMIVTFNMSIYPHCTSSLHPNEEAVESHNDSPQVPWQPVPAVK